MDIQARNSHPPFDLKLLPVDLSLLRRDEQLLDLLGDALRLANHVVLRRQVHALLTRLHVRTETFVRRRSTSARLCTTATETGHEGVLFFVLETTHRNCTKCGKRELFEPGAGTAAVSLSAVTPRQLGGCSGDRVVVVGVVSGRTLRFHARARTLTAD